MPSPTISIIIPVFQESPLLLAQAIRSSLAEGADEVIVVDGGSNGRTKFITRRLRARLVISTPAQRARQMNSGARVARGNLLLFLHADSTFLPGSLDALRAVAASRPAVVGGGFLRHYRSRSLLLAASCRIGNARAARLGWYYGDQAIWARRKSFFHIGGFPETPLFEDLDLSRRLRRLGQLRTITPGIETSARRFRKGVLTRLAKDVLVTLRHVCLKPVP